MSFDEIAIRAENLSKHYLMFKRPEDRLKQMIVPRLKRIVTKTPANYYDIFEAVRHVSLEIRRGETVGIIGRNGSGKSTLLQMLCGTLQATSGTLSVNGRIAALLELGAGFDPEFTGRENVYMNGAIIGLSRAEIDARFKTIEDFADIGQFIDQPAKTYSSGMYVRLAFAVAINSDPDILVVDEALSVGDEAFQRKCFARIEQIQAKGATILFVSHSAQSVVKLCDRAVLMDAGEAILQGKPKRVVSQYQRLINLSGEAAVPVRAAIKAMNNQPDITETETDDQTDVDGNENTLPDISSGAVETMDPSWFDPGLVSQSIVAYESKGAEISNARITNDAGESVNNLAIGRRYMLQYNLHFTMPQKNFLVGMMIKTKEGVDLAGSHNRRIGTKTGDDVRLIKQVAAGDTLLVQFDFTCVFRAGAYFMTSGVMSEGEAHFLHRLVDMLAFRVMDGTDPSDCDAGTVAMDSALSMRVKL